MSDTYNLFQQGRTHLREGMAAQATVSLEKAKRREPEKASIREALGIAYFRIHRYEEAESELRKLLELAPAVVKEFGLSVGETNGACSSPRSSLPSATASEGKINSAGRRQWPSTRTKANCSSPTRATIASL